MREKYLLSTNESLAVLTVTLKELDESGYIDWLYKISR
jgi:hypothetical protein